MAETLHTSIESQGVVADADSISAESTFKSEERKVKASKHHRRQRLRLISDRVYALHSPCGGRQLLKAASEGDLEAVRLLLARGANPNAQDLLGNTALHLATCTNRIKIITHLLKAGSNIRMLDGYGKSPISVASGKLRLIMLAPTSHRGGSTGRCTDLKFEVQQVIDMMTAYMELADKVAAAPLCVGGAATARWDDACNRMHRSTTIDEANDAVSEMLSSFTSITLSGGEG